MSIAGSVVMFCIKLHMAARSAQEIVGSSFISTQHTLSPQTRRLPALLQAPARLRYYCELMPEQSCRLAAQSPRALPAIPVWRTWCNPGAVPCQISCIFLPSRASTSAPGDGDAALSSGNSLRLFIAGRREFVESWSFAACATWLNRRPKASRPLGWPGWKNSFGLHRHGHSLRTLLHRVRHLLSEGAVTTDTTCRNAWRRALVHAQFTGEPHSLARIPIVPKPRKRAQWYIHDDTFTLAQVP